MNRISSAITTNDKVHRCVVTLSNKPKINLYFSLCGKNVTVHFSKLHFFSTVSVSSCMWGWWMVVEHHDLTSPIHSYNELKVEKNATSNFEIISSPWRPLRVTSSITALTWKRELVSQCQSQPRLLFPSCLDCASQRPFGWLKQLGKNNWSYDTSSLSLASTVMLYVLVCYGSALLSRQLSKLWILALEVNEITYNFSAI